MIPQSCKCCGSELTAYDRVYLASKQMGRKAFTVAMLTKKIPDLPYTHIGQACLQLEQNGRFLGKLELLPDKNGKNKHLRVYMRVK